jgi:hypothetical protein
MQPSSVVVTQHLDEKGSLVCKKWSRVQHSTCRASAHFVSKRTTLYADLVNERRDGMPSNRRETGYDVGIKRNF